MPHVSGQRKQLPTMETDRWGPEDRAGSADWQGFRGEFVALPGGNRGTFCLHSRSGSSSQQGLLQPPPPAKPARV